MKINESWIFKFLYLDSKKLLKLFNKSELEINNIQILNFNINKIISGKIINVYKNNNTYDIELDIGKSKNINIKQYINYNNSIKNSIVAVIFLKKNINNDNVFIYTSNILNINNNNDVITISNNLKLGINISNLLDIKNKIIDICIPNNRLDCSNVFGISKEISLFNNIKIKLPFNGIKINSNINNTFKLNINNKNICYKYSYLIINNLDNNLNIPINIKEKLIHSDIKIKNNIYDIIDYIFLETGYKINIFNTSEFKNNEIFIKLLDKDLKYLVKNKYIFLNKKTLVICNNNNKILYVPGLDINFNNNLYYSNPIVVGCGSFNFESISLNRYIYKDINFFIKNNEIEVNKKFIKDILKYFISIILNISKINFSCIKEKNNLSIFKYIYLNINKLYKFLGFNIKYENIINILYRLEFKYYINNNNINIIKVRIPRTRPDIKEKEDLFEEIIRIYGYNKINKLKKQNLFKNNYKLCKLSKFNNKKIIIDKIKTLLVIDGYNEVITYSLINKNEQSYIFNLNQVNIINPISENMSSIRKSLLIGLLKTIKFNENRKNNNIKIFEHGFCFDYINNIITNKEILSGLNYGMKKNDFFKIKYNDLFDFYDIKGNIENILLFLYNKNEFIFIKNKNNNIFNIEKSLMILDVVKNMVIGYFGYINDKIIRLFKLKNNVIYFEIYISNINFLKKNYIEKIYNHPINEKDISISINNNDNIYSILKYLNFIKGNEIIEINLVDYYEEKILDNNILNNFTIRFYIQDKNKTLTDININKIINYYIYNLENKFNIKIKK